MAAKTTYGVCDRTGYKYYPIWHEIKTKGHCTVSVHPSLHTRVKLAVTKEKCYDLVYKLECELAGLKTPVLSVTGTRGNKNLITFTLIKELTIGDL